jgi:glycosyltransferase involved in cell wall biosynthesis
MRISPLGIDAGLYGRTFTEAELTAFRQRYDLEPGYVCQVGRIEEKKNQLAVIQALYDDPLPLVFDGKDSLYYAPDYADRCREMAARRGRVKFLGWLPETELPLLYAASAAHILPSWVELPGLSSLEAGAAGTRVITTCISGMQEILGTEAGYCDPWDLQSIRSAVLTALASPVPGALRARLLSEYSWRAVAARNLSLYQDAMGLIQAGHPFGRGSS